MSKILVVDDDPQARESTQKILALSGYEVVTAQDGQEALDLVRSSQFDLVLSDVRMPKLGGLEFLRALSLCGGRMPVILMTAFGKVEDAVWAMKLGAVDFLTKPFKRQTVLAAIENALKRVAAQPVQAQVAVGAGQGPKIIGSSDAIKVLRQQISQVAGTAATVLVTGESGTGKELVARTIHAHSARAQRPFIALNCAAVPENLIESELFGHEKGSFTGATQTKQGLFEAANGGTLLLDEIGDMPLPLQAKLLRVLQENEIRRVGATQSRQVDVRVIAATNRNLREAVSKGAFREDLLYRLEVISLRVPSLKERQDDVLELTAHFLAQSAQRHAKTVSGIGTQALAVLRAHQWPGNVRELANVIERAVVFAQPNAEIGLPELPPHLLEAVPAQLLQESSSAVSPKNIVVPMGTPLKEVKEMLIEKTLEATGGDKSMTAKLLGINERTIYRQQKDSAVGGGKKEE